MIKLKKKHSAPWKTRYSQDKEYRKKRLRQHSERKSFKTFVKVMGTLDKVDKENDSTIES